MGAVNIRESYLDVKTKKGRIRQDSLTWDLSQPRGDIHEEGYLPGIDTPTFFHYTPWPEIELISVLNQ